MTNKYPLILSVLILFIHCTGPVDNLYPPDNNAPDNKKIYIVKHRWHTGIIFNRKEANPYFPAMKNEFLNAKYFEAGWGDLDFYTADKGNVLLALKAVLWPTKSALHIVAYQRHPALIYGKNRIAEILISNQGFINLIKYINDSYALDSDSLNIQINEASQGPSRFYLSNEKYHGFKTCNVWTAKAIRKTGYPITPFYALTAKNVLKQVKD